MALYPAILIQGFGFALSPGPLSFFTRAARVPMSGLVLFCTVWCLLECVVVPRAHARDLSDIDLSLRLPAALAKFSPYSDVAALGGASAGSPYQSSVNPAATDWHETSPYTIGLSSQYQAIQFDRDLTLHVVAESATLKTDGLGSIQPAAAQVISTGSRAGTYTLLNGNYGQLQWGYKIRQNLAVGLNINYTSLDVDSGIAPMLAAVNSSQTVEVRGGLLFNIYDHVLFGLVGDYAIAPATTTVSDFVCGCSVASKDTTREILIRPGLSWEYAEKSTIYIDYQYGNYWNSTGGFATNRVLSGVEQQIFTWLYARGGLAVDLRGVLSPTVGIGIYPTSNTSIDLGFQSNMFPELIPELGSSKVFGISAAITF